MATNNKFRHLNNQLRDALNRNTRGTVTRRQMDQAVRILTEEGDQVQQMALAMVRKLDEEETLIDQMMTSMEIRRLQIMHAVTLPTDETRRDALLKVVEQGKEKNDEAETSTEPLRTESSDGHGHMESPSENVQQPEHDTSQEDGGS